MTTTTELATMVYTSPFVHKDDDMGSEVPMAWSHRWESSIGNGTMKVGRKQAEEPVIAPALTREET